MSRLSDGPVPRTEPNGATLPQSRPLVVTGDEEMLDDLLRLAAAAGVEVEVAGDASAARARWSRVPLVIVADDLAGGLARLAPTRRAGVVLVGRERDDPGVWQRGVALGAEHVLFFPEDEPWLAGRLADAAEGDTSDAVVLGVVGGRGGAGASVLATALSVTAGRRGRSVVLVDLDPLGGGLDLVLGAENSPGLRWDDLADSRGRLSARALRDELPRGHGLAVLSCGRNDGTLVSPVASQAVLAAARRACDLVVLDLPRRADAAVDEALAHCSSVLLVVPTEVRATAAATTVATGLSASVADVRVVTRGVSPAGLGGNHIATALGLPLAAHMADESRLPEYLDRGEPPGCDPRGPLATTCASLLDELLPAPHAGAA
ncbi:septum site-determining protein Ssd [Haloactinopolyspora alba]|uniref:septum site-determining protein Ssd n=1 Tax=Haloactinopolyspora alba TaxID=648780 RepID=UPI00197AC5C8|nr:septum site-determining protein Ssd [Haloactinopolyspora alba]